MSAGDGSSDPRIIYVGAADLPEAGNALPPTMLMHWVTDLLRVVGGGPQTMYCVPVSRPLAGSSLPRPDMATFDRIVNLNTEPEHDQILPNVRELIKDAPEKVLNHPDAVLETTREKIAQRLSDIPGLLVPRTIRIAKADACDIHSAIRREGLRFPIILRRAGTHTGSILGRFESWTDLPAAVEQIGDLIATEFVDFRSADGLYRKYRVFFYGSRAVLRHMLVSDYWNVHMKDRSRFMRGRTDLQAEEEALFRQAESGFPPQVASVLGQVRDRLPLDFFGIDYGFAPDGRMLLFEANAGMNFFPFLDDPQFGYVRRCLPLARAACREMLGLPAVSGALHSTGANSETV